MKKKILAIVLVSLVSVNIGACRNKNTDKKVSDTEITNNIQEQINENINSENESENILENDNYEWIVKPTIEADDIIVFDNGQIPIHGVNIYRYDETTGNEEEIQTLSHDKYAIIKQAGKYGFIGYDGIVLAKPEYKSYGCHARCGEIYIYNTQGEYYYLNEEGEPVTGYSMCGDGSFNIEYQSSSNTFSSEYWTRTLEHLDIAVPVIEKNDSESVYQGEQIGKYGIYYDGKLISDYQYDDYICCIVNGTQIGTDMSEDMYSFAMKKDNKWYLFDRYGRQILSDGCESIPSNNEYNDYQYANPYIFTDGVCAISQYGGMRYIDINGDDIIENGIFEEVRPVYNGMAWVKQDGKWGVIKLKK